VASARLHRKDFKTLTRLRAKDARALVRSGNEQGAYYLAGYAVECALKACIASKTKRSEFPPSPQEVRDNFYTHDLTMLLKTAGLEKLLEKDMTLNASLATNWNTVKGWDEQCRYRCSGLNGRDMEKAIRGANGVLRWIKQHW